jgi:hypothetical protein
MGEPCLDRVVTGPERGIIGAVQLGQLHLPMLTQEFASREDSRNFFFRVMQGRMLKKYGRSWSRTGDECLM